LAHSLYRDASPLDPAVRSEHLAQELHALALRLKRRNVQGEDLYRMLWLLLTYLFEAPKRYK
jgi:hypothetical protein